MLAVIFYSLFQEPKEEEEEENEPEDEEEKQQIVNQEFLIAAFDCLGQSWPKTVANTQGKQIPGSLSWLANRNNNRPFPSSPKSLFQSESKCEIFVMVISSNFNMNEN